MLKLLTTHREVCSASSLEQRNAWAHVANLSSGRGNDWGLVEGGRTDVEDVDEDDICGRRELKLP